MWTKTKIAIQQANELRDFVKNLAARRITTPEFKSALMILRQHCGRGSALLEWTDSVAHQKRDRGITFEAGNSLWLERFQVNTTATFSGISIFSALSFGVSYGRGKPGDCGGYGTPLVSERN
jgi:hypothetical protein